MDRVHQHAPHPAEARVAGHFPRQRHPVHAGHIPVEQRQVERAAVSLSLAQYRQRRAAAGGGAAFGAPGHQLPPQMLAAEGVIVDDQDATTLERIVVRIDRCPGGVDFERNAEPENRAFARLAVQPDFPAHQRHDLRTDGQAQAGAAVLAVGRAIGLGKGFENLFLQVPRDPDPGIAHLETQVGPLCVAAL